MTAYQLQKLQTMQQTSTQAQALLGERPSAEQAERAAVLFEQAARAARELAADLRGQSER